VSGSILSFRVAVAESDYRGTSWDVTRTPVAVAQINPPTADLDRERRKRFGELLAQWSAETAHVSSITDMVSHPAYRAIIELGMPAIGLILEQLRREPDFWFEALRQISGTDPVRREDAGDLVRMTQSWLDWGEHQGYA
jgi:hypothetical protein